MLWKAADKANPNGVQITKDGWDVTMNANVITMQSKEPAAPEKLMDVISYSCQVEGNAFSKKCILAVNGLSCTGYCVCEPEDSCCNGLTQRMKMGIIRTKVKMICMLVIPKMKVENSSRLMMVRTNVMYNILM